MSFLHNKPIATSHCKLLLDISEWILFKVIDFLSKETITKVFLFKLEQYTINVLGIRYLISMTIPHLKQYTI